MAEAMLFLTFQPILTFQPSRGHTATEAMACYTGLFVDLHRAGRRQGSAIGAGCRTASASSGS